MRITLKNIPKLKLGDLLKRKKMTLKHFLHEFGITTYEGMLNRCDRMGVTAPDEKEFKVCFPDELPKINNPLEGVIVLEPLDSSPEPEPEPELPLRLRSGFILLNDDSVDPFEKVNDLDEPLRRSKKKKDLVTTYD